MLAISSKKREMLFTPKHPNLHWGPPSLFSGYRRPSEVWDSVIGIATPYGLDVAGIESRCG